MTPLRIAEPVTPEWKQWRADAEAGAKLLAGELRATGAFTVDEKLYRQRKADYFHLYHGKCVYCESPLRVDGWDQLDHFRPKNAVLGADRKPVKVGVKQHPGYHWLAYEWTNLVPSCAICNQSKGAIFPLLAGTKHALKPKDLATESPVLLHPALKRYRPETHFEYLPKTGALKLKTTRARAIDEIVKLNREGLFDARRKCFKAAVTLVADYINCIKSPSDENAIEAATELEKIINGVAEYSFVGRHALRSCAAQLGPFFARIGP